MDPPQIFDFNGPIVAGSIEGARGAAMFQRFLGFVFHAVAVVLLGTSSAVITNYAALILLDCVRLEREVESRE